MNILLSEICHLAVAVGEAKFVEIVLEYSSPACEEVISSNQPRITNSNVTAILRHLLDGQTDIMVRNIARVPQLANSANLRGIQSLAYFVAHDDGNLRVSLLFVDPDQRFFDSPYTYSAIQHLLQLIHAVVAGSVTPPDHLSRIATPSGLLQEAPGNLTPFRPEPILNFLISTLPERQRLLGRNGVTYIGLRSWRKSIKDHQISALSAFKKSPHQEGVSHIASEITEAIKRLYGNVFQAVVPVPCGSSGRSDCLSMQLGHAVARNLSVPAIEALASTAAKGSSHPRNNARLQPFTLKEPVPDCVLVVDDVATSGKHLELAINTLRQVSQFVQAVAWISD